jgi:hypothetical protein
MFFHNDFDIDYSETKSLILEETRGISFDNVCEAIINGKVLDDKRHHNPKKYPNQSILAVKIGDYVFAVPYVVDRKKRRIFLKTAYPSHILTKKYHEKNNIR